MTRFHFLFGWRATLALPYWLNTSSSFSLFQPHFEAIHTLFHLFVTVYVHYILLLLLLNTLAKSNRVLKYEAARKGLSHDGEVGDEAAKVGEHLAAAIQTDALASLEK